MSQKTAYQEYHHFFSEIEKSPSLQNYLHAHSALKDIDWLKEGFVKRGLKVAILSTFTIDHIKPFLFIESLRSSIFSELYIGPYNQAPQEIINPNSAMYKFAPDILVLALQADKLNPEVKKVHELSKKEREDLISNIVGNIRGLVEKFFLKSPSSYLLLHNFVVPHYSPHGILDWKIDSGIRDFYYRLNIELAGLAKDFKHLFIFDIENFASLHGKNNFTDQKFLKLAQMEINASLMPLLAKKYVKYFKAVCGFNKKCLVLDLDNTLWGGVVGEEGIEKIRLGDDPPGNCFLDFQKHILDLYNKGVILAIISKNNFEDGIEVIKKHPKMLLREKHFASIKINWLDKPQNIGEIAKELNIGLDSMVFIDDDPLERMLMRKALPEVLTVEMPDDPAFYSNALIQLDSFETISLTEDDKKRGEYYAQEKRRQDLKQSSLSIEEFLKSLNMELFIKKAGGIDISRAAQLTQRTNQFNLTTRRYSEEDIKRISSMEEYKILILNYKDCFGDSGLTGLCIIKKAGCDWIIDSFLISCRIMGRGVESAFLGDIFERARNNGAKSIKGEFIPTAKNMPASDFFERHNFKKISSDKKNESTFWEFNLKSEANPKAEWIKVNGN